MLEQLKYSRQFLWNEIKNILPYEKSGNIIDTLVVSYRKVIDGIIFVLRKEYRWKILPREYGSGSTCH